MMPLPCRGRLEANAEQWNELLTTLEELIEWTSERETEIERQQPVGGDVHSIRQQHLDHQVSPLSFTAIRQMAPLHEKFKETNWVGFLAVIRKWRIFTISKNTAVHVQVTNCLENCCMT